MLSDKKAKFLMVRLSTLRQELQITKETFRYADSEFHKAFNEKYFPEIAQKNKEDSTLSTGEENEEEIKKAREKAQESEKEFHEEPGEDVLSTNKSLDPKMKKMFKSIAKKTHPDKLLGMTDKEKEKKKDLYAEATRAFENDDFASLYLICKELDLELPEIDEHKIKKMEEQISSTKQEINKLKSTFMWEWLFAPNEMAKESLIDQLFSRMYPRT